MISFDFLGSNSYNDFGIKIKKRPLIPLAERNVTYTPIQGKSGSLTFDENTYKDITIAVDCYLVDNDLSENIYNIKAWLSGGMGDLIFNFEDSRIYIAQVVNRIDIAQSLRVLGSFTIMFNCKPFAYDYNSYYFPLTIFTATNMNNCGSYYCEPIITVNGTGNITLYVADQVVSLTNVVGSITLDSELQEAYKGDIPCNSQMSGEFPIFKVGYSLIHWTGTVSSISIQPNFRWL